MNIVSIPVTIDELAALWKMRHGEVVAAIPNVTPPATRPIIKMAATTTAALPVVSIPVTIDELAALWKMRHGEVVAAIPNVTPPATLPIIKMAATTTAVLPVALITGKCQYKILGEHRSAKTSVAAYLDILTTLSSVEPDLPERLSLVTPASSRNHIARSRDGVYPLRPDLGRKAREFAPGWYAGRNIADREKRRILQRACGILGLQFGKDVAF